MTSLTSRIYELLKQVPPGHVTTYKDLAHAAGTHAYRAIGRAMASNPFSFLDEHDAKKQIPCHRVVASDGKLHGFMGKTKGEALKTKEQLLAKEGVRCKNHKVQNFSKVKWKFTI